MGKERVGWNVFTTLFVHMIIHFSITKESSFRTIFTFDNDKEKCVRFYVEVR